MAKATLLDHVPIPHEQVFPMVQDPVPAMLRLPTNQAGIPRFDVIHLGMGEDGHTASLFPGSPALQERQALVYYVHDAPKPPPERVTLTLPVINAARAVLFMVQGASKREALERVLRGDPALPASLVKPVDGELQFIVDRAAVGQ
jgi:6-phosphogluconolactonase